MAGGFLALLVVSWPAHVHISVARPWCGPPTKSCHPSIPNTYVTLNMAHHEASPRCWIHPVVLGNAALEVPLILPTGSRTTWTTVQSAATLSGIAKTTLTDALAREFYGKRVLAGVEELRPLKAAGVLRTNAPNVQIVQISLMESIMAERNLPKGDIAKLAKLRQCMPPPLPVRPLADHVMERPAEMLRQPGTSF